MQMFSKIVVVRGFIMRTQPICKSHHLLQFSVYSIVLRLGFARICRIDDPDQWVFDCCLKSCCHSSSLRYKRYICACGGFVSELQALPVGWRTQAGKRVNERMYVLCTVVVLIIAFLICFVKRKLCR